MKTILLIIAAILLKGAALFADNTTAGQAVSPTVNVQVKIADSLAAKIDKAVQAATYPPSIELSWRQDVLVLLPVLLFLLFLFISLAVLKKAGFKLGDALSENEPVQKTVPNPNANLAAANPTITISEYPQSSSRLLAFLTSIVAVLLVLSTTTFSFYFGLKFGRMPDLGNLQTFALSLGVGVVPYAFNRVANVFK